MADTAKRLVGPALLGVANAVLYTVPANTTAILRNIHISNGGGTTYTASLSINGSGATIANQLFGGLSIGQQTVIDWSGFIVLHAGDTIQGLSNNGASLSIVISGIEVT